MTRARRSAALLCRTFEWATIIVIGVFGIPLAYLGTWAGHQADRLERGG